MATEDRPAILDGSHFCDRAGDHKNIDCWEHICVCSLCGEFWHWNIRRWQQAREEVR